MSGNGAINLIMVVDRLVATWTCCKQRWPYYLDPLAAILRWIWASFRSPKPLAHPLTDMARVGYISQRGWMACSCGCL